MAARGGEGIAGGLPVLRDERCILAGPLGRRLGDRARDGSVKPRALCRELRAVCDLLREWMLEGVLLVGKERRRDDELGC